MSGEASIWSPRTVLDLAANIMVDNYQAVRDYTGTETTLYARGAATLADGGQIFFQQMTGAAGTYVDDNALTLVPTGGNGSIGWVSLPPASQVVITANNYQAIRDYTGTEPTLYARGATALADGGEAFFQQITGAAVGFYVDNNTTVLVPTGGNGSIGWVRKAHNVYSTADTVSLVNEPEVVLSNTYITKDYLTSSPGGGGIYDVVLTSSVTPVPANYSLGLNLFTSIATPTLSFILRASDFINPAQYGQVSPNYTIYVSTTGFDTNTGMSISNPVLTLQKAFDISEKIVGNETLTIQIAAGTYPEGGTLENQPNSNRSINISGPSVPMGTVPTAIIDGFTGTNVIGIYLRNGVNALISDIKLSNWTAGAAGTGLAGENICNIFTKNVHVTNCSRGLFASSASRLRVQGGIIDTCTTGITCISNVTYTIGQGGTLASALGDTGPTIKNCVQAGVFVQEGATGHVDYTYIDTCGVGVDVTERSRVHLQGSHLLNNTTTGVRVRLLSTWYDNKTVANTFTGNGTSSSSGINVLLSKSIRSEEETNSLSSVYLVRDTNSVTANSTALVVARTYPIPLNTFSTRGSGFHLILSGEGVGLGTLTMTLFGTNIMPPSFINFLNTIWDFDVKMYVRDASGATPSLYVIVKALNLFSSTSNGTARMASATFPISAAAAGDLVISARTGGTSGDLATVSHSQLEIFY